jgi:outer membrane protein TolC
MMFRFVTLLVLFCTLNIGADDMRFIGLKEAQSFAIENNQMLRVAQSQVAQAEARKVQTWAGHLPHISVSESGIRTNDAVNAFGFRLRQERFEQPDFAVAALNAPKPITNFQTQLEIRQPLFRGGQTMYGRKAASAEVGASVAEWVRHKQIVRFETAKAYWGTVLAQEALKAVRLGLDTAKQHASNTEVRYRQESADMADVLAARVRVAELEGEEITARNEIASALDALALVMGMDFDISLSLTDSLARKPVPTDLDKLLELANQHRPDLQASRLQEKARAHSVGVARSAYLPHVNAFATFSFDSQDFLKRQGESWFIGGQVTWAIFSGGQTIGKVREANAIKVGAGIATEFKRADVAREVRAAYRHITAANTQVDIAERAVRHAEERLRIAQLQYREGLSTSLDLLTAESELRRVRVQLLRSFYTLVLGVSGLELVVGQSF